MLSTVRTITALMTSVTVGHTGTLTRAQTQSGAVRGVGGSTPGRVSPSTAPNEYSLQTTRKRTPNLARKISRWRRIQCLRTTIPVVNFYEFPASITSF